MVMTLLKWTKEETDQLFDMCQRFDLRFVVIADRFPSSRSVEELKHRYYSVSKAICRLEKTTVPVDTASPSNMQVTSGVAPLASMAENVAAAAASLRTLRVYLRTYALEQMVQAASSTAGLRTIKRIEQFLQELMVNLKPKVPTKSVCAEHLELRKEILAKGVVYHMLNSICVLLFIVLWVSCDSVKVFKAVSDGTLNEGKNESASTNLLHQIIYLNSVDLGMNESATSKYTCK